MRPNYCSLPFLLNPTAHTQMTSTLTWWYCIESFRCLNKLLFKVLNRAKFLNGLNKMWWCVCVCRLKGSKPSVFHSFFSGENCLCKKKIKNKHWKSYWIKHHVETYCYCTLCAKLRVLRDLPGRKKSGKSVFFSLGKDTQKRVDTLFSVFSSWFNWKYSIIVHFVDGS